MKHYLNTLTLKSIGFRKTIAAGSLVIALASSAGFVFAHDASNQDRIADRFDYIFTQLNLTEDQSAATIDIMQTQREEMREQHRANREAGAERPTAEQREVLRTEAYTALADELGSVLQADQVEGLMSYLEAHQPKGGKGNRGEHQGGRHHQMKQSSPAL